MAKRLFFSHAIFLCAFLSAQDQFQEKNKSRHADRPYEAAEFFVDQRSQEGTPIPLEKYEQAIEHANKMTRYSIAAGRTVDSKSPRSASIGQWETLGPGNLGGRVRSLLIHPRQPDTMFVGAVAGGVWKTTDAGRNWRPLTDFLPFLSIGSLAMDPRDTERIYAGTGEGYSNFNAIRGGAIYRTTDGGTTWTVLASTRTNEFQFVNKIIVSPTESRRIYAATNAGIMRSTDAGATWRVVLSRGLPHRGCHDLIIRTDVPADVMLASCGTPYIRREGGLRNKVDPREDERALTVVFRTADGAVDEPWEQVLFEQNMGRTTLAFAPSNQNIVYAVATSIQSGFYNDALLGLFRSNSAGAAGTWQARLRNASPAQLQHMLLSNAATWFCTSFDGPNSQGTYDNVIAVDPRDPERVWVGGIDLYRSDDGGNNFGIASQWWSRSARTFVHADQHVIAFHPGYNGTTNRTMFVANDGGIYKTDDARSIVGRGNAAACSSLASAMSYSSLNNGLTVAQFYQGAVYPGGAIYLGGMQDLGSAAGGDGTGPNRWVRFVTGDGTAAAVNPEDVNFVYTAGPNFNLLRSTDGGNFSTSAREGIIEGYENFLFVAPLALDPREPRRLYAGGTQIWRTNDGASRWDPASAKLTDAKLSAVVVSPHNSNVAFAGSARGQVFRTESAIAANGFSAWTASQPRSGYLSSIVVDPTDPNTVYATYSAFNRDPGDRHIYRSRDLGATWQAIDGTGAGAIPDVPVNSLAIDPFQPATLYAGTDLGIFVSTDGGLAWAREEAPFPNAPVNQLLVRKEGEGAQLFAFTHGRGLWRVRLKESAPCSYALAPLNVNIGPAGGVVTANVSTSPDCFWSSVTDSTWITVLGGAQGVGNGSVRIAVDTHDAALPLRRQAQVWIADKTFTIAQDAAALLQLGDQVTEPRDVVTFPHVSLHDTRRAATNSQDPVHSCTNARDSKGIWFRLQPTFTGRIQVAVSYNLWDTSRNALPVVAVYDTRRTEENEIACGKNTSETFEPAELVFNATSGRTYFIQVSAGGSNNGGGYAVVVLRQAVSSAEVLPSLLNFGEVKSGESLDRIFAIKNVGTAPLEIRSITSSSPLFEIISPKAAVTLANRPSLLAVGNPIQDVIVRFSPTSGGGQSGTITIVTNDPKQANYVVSVLGGGSGSGGGETTSPQVTVSTESIDFESVVIGESKELPLVVRNPGKTALTIKSVTTSDPAFTVSGMEASATLAPNAELQLKVKYTPTEEGAKTGTLIITSNDLARPTLTVALSGTGATP